MGYYNRVNEIEQRFKRAINLMIEKRLDSRKLAKELSVSRPTALRIINELRRRGYIVQAVHDNIEGWRYTVSHLNKIPVLLVKPGKPAAPNNQTS